MSVGILELLYPLIMLAVIVLFARHRLYAAVAAWLMTTFFIILALVPQIPFAESGEVSFTSGLLLSFSMLGVMCISPLILLSVAPAKAVSRRLIFLALGLLLLIALNELSKLGLDVTAPKLNG